MPSSPLPGSRLLPQWSLINRLPGELLPTLRVTPRPPGCSFLMLDFTLWCFYRPFAPALVSHSLFSPCPLQFPMFQM